MTEAFLGILIEKRDPMSGSDSKEMPPPCWLRIRLEMNNPRPVPRSPLEEKKGVNTLARVDSSIPMPLSDTLR